MQREENIKLAYAVIAYKDKLIDNNLNLDEVDEIIKHTHDNLTNKTKEISFTVKTKYGKYFIELEISSSHCWIFIMNEEKTAHRVEDILHPYSRREIFEQLLEAYK